MPSSLGVLTLDVHTPIHHPDTVAFIIPSSLDKAYLNDGDAMEVVQGSLRFTVWILLYVTLDGQVASNYLT